MAKVKTTIRNAPLNQLRTEIGGGRMYVCSGVVPNTLAIPGASDILSQHDIIASPGTVSNGVYTIPDADIAPDPAANNTGTPSYVVFADAANAPVGVFAVPSQMSLTLNLPTGDTQIVQGREVDVDSVVITEGNP